MMEQLMTEIVEQDNVRSQISELRKVCREKPENRRQCCDEKMLKRFHELLASEDSKTRKNAALLLGDVADEILAVGKGDEVAAWLFEAYGRETTNFVLSSYVHALAQYDCSPFLEQFQRQLMDLTEQTTEEENIKHVRELRREIERILSGTSSQTQVAFHGIHKRHSLLLTAEPYIQEALEKQLQSRRISQTKIGSGGVRVMTDTLDFLGHISLYREVLFVLRQKAGAVLDRDHIAEGIVASECIPLLREVFGERDSYFFRLSFRGRGEEMDGKAIKKICCQIEELSNYRLRNTTSDYMVDVLLYPKKDGTYALYGKLPALKDERFPYRLQTLPTSMSPVTAAQMVELISPYLKAGAHIIDPFCGTGTLLIERCKRMDAKDVYGVDIYGDAILKARENTKAAQMDVYYIHRDYFDFTSEYRLDEVLTEFPRMENKRREEVDLFYRKFFEKTAEVTSREAMLFLLSTEENCIKKQVRIQKEFQLLRQIPMRGQENIYILKKRG